MGCISPCVAAHAVEVRACVAKFRDFDVASACRPALQTCATTEIYFWPRVLGTLRPVLQRLQTSIAHRRGRFSARLKEEFMG